MKVLLFVGILAIVQASGQYDSLLQRLGERQTSPEDSQKDSDEILRDEIERLKYRVSYLERVTGALNDQEIEATPDNSDNSQPDGEDQPGTTQREKEKEVNSGSGSENNENTPEANSMRVLLEKIKSRMDETKREQPQTMSDALSRILKTLRRK